MSATGLSGAARSPVAIGNHGMNAMPFAGRVVQHVLRLAVGQVVEVLHAGDLGDRARLLDLVDRHLGETDVPHLALLLQLGEAPTWSSSGTSGSILWSWIRSIRSTRRLRRLSSTCCLRYAGRPTAVHSPGPVRVKPALVAMTRPVGVGMQCLGDQLLADHGAVAVRGVDEVHAALDGGPEDSQCALVVLRRAPDAVAGDLHGAVAEPVHLEVAAESEGVGVVDGGRRGHTVTNRGHPWPVPARWCEGSDSPHRKAATADTSSGRHDQPRQQVGDRDLADPQQPQGHADQHQPAGRR